jgi:hypothetical protein
MKNSHQHLNWSSIILVFSLAGAGCVKSSPGLPVMPVCYVSLMNQAPYSYTTDIYFNGTLVTTNGGIPPGKFSSQYGSVKPGVYTVDFKKTGTDSLLYELAAASYDTLNFYTLILYNTAPMSPAVQAVRIADDFSSVTASSAYYRFFNLSPDMPSVDLYLNGTISQLNRTPADNVANPVYDEFQPLNAMVYNIQVKDANSDSVLATLPSTAMAAGSVYTIFLEGTSAGVVLSVLPAAY